MSLFFLHFTVRPPGASSDDFGSEVGQVADDCLTAGMPGRWYGIKWGYMVDGIAVSPANDDDDLSRRFRFLFSMSACPMHHFTFSRDD